MKQENEIGVFSLKFSVFSDRGVWPVDDVGFELIRIPGFGRYRKPTVGIGRLRKFRVTNFDLRMETEASSVGNGRYRTPKVGIGRLKKFEEEMGYGTTKVLADGLRYANEAARCVDQYRESEMKVAGGGSYRQLTADQKNILMRGYDED